jgi:hypothetical protein
LNPAADLKTSLTLALSSIPKTVYYPSGIVIVTLLMFGSVAIFSCQATTLFEIIEETFVLLYFFSTAAAFKISPALILNF